MTTLLRRFLPVFVLAACGMLSFAQPGGEKDTKEEIAEMKVRLRLNTIECAKQTDHYTALIGREISLKESVKAATNAADVRLPEFEQALADVRSELNRTKKKLIELETDKDKLIERLGPKNVAEITTEPTDKLTRVLDRILDRLDSIDKRLQKLEQQK